MAGHIASFDSLSASTRRTSATPVWDTIERGLDLALVAGTSPVWVPILLLVALAKLLIDGRPVLFDHERLGRDGRPFRLHKIRTTPRHFQPSPDDWSDEDFPPRTPFGRWLRRFDLDELPQLWNVLKGEMSLVGPRPEMPRHAEVFSHRIPEYSERLVLRPGLTGLAQVRGWRGNTCIQHRLLCDLEYLESRGPARYFEILARTVWVETRRAIRGR
jgi:lipopolysaccharide/colanic/teichoic acid biosynthesis glycosyltransferase